MQDIAPTYYDLDSFAKGDMKNALQRTVDKVKRKAALKGGRDGSRRER
jgi:pre-mRNA-splicing factor ATP-dependent RNA helicase DHX15/PRP43